MRSTERGSLRARALIVTDDARVADTFSRALRLEGCEVWAAMSSQEGFDLASAHRPDVVVFDMRTPLVRALDLVRALRARPGLEQATVAIVTGDYRDHARAVEAVTAGIELRYTPFWLDELVALARDLMVVPVRP